MLKYESISELVREAEARGVKISELVLQDQSEAMETTPLELYEKMEIDFSVMAASVEAGQRKDQKSMSGLTGGEGWKMKTYAEKTNGGLCGPFLAKAISRALAVAGCNASMGRIVAAPTAGSCGILPGCLVSLWEDQGFDQKDIVMSMFTAGAFGMVIAGRASIAGAQGGCQAECGSAAAMAAAALVELMGGTPSQCADACAIAIANQLGLVCDPVAGLVEIPGFAGQKLIPETLDKVRALREELDRRGYGHIMLEVDGNVSFENAPKMRAAGADIFVAGTSSVFTKDMDFSQATGKLRELIK